MVEVSDEDRELERRTLVRAVRQRLEGLRRAGVDRLPFLPVLPVEKAPRAPRSGAATGQASPGPPPIIETPKLVVPQAPVVESVVTHDPAPPAAELQMPVPPRPAPVRSLFDIEETVSAPVPAAERPSRLAALAAEVAECRRCPILAATRTQTVFGVGSPTARLMFVGEAPGADEDRQGEPFVGRAGMLLTDMITKGMGLSRDVVYIANVLKSRPPENRNPEPDEIAHCLPFLERQIEIIRPEFLCLLGRIATSSLLNTALPLSRLRGKWHRFKGIPTIVTYHPAYLLRNPADKKKAWEDLQMLMKAMGLKPPGRSSA